MVEIKKDRAVYGEERKRLVFDLMKKFPVGNGNMSVIFTMEEAAATIVEMQWENARLTAERDEARAATKAAYERAAAATSDTDALTEIVKRAVDAETREMRTVLTLIKRAGDLREVYHSLPNEHNRIGDKRSRKGHARDAWLRAFRKADREARAILARIDQRKKVN